VSAAAAPATGKAGKAKRAAEVQAALAALEELAGEAKERLQQAGATLVCRKPFFAVIWLYLKKRATIAIAYPDGTYQPIPTMATDGVYLYYNPAFVCELTPKELVAVCAHEVVHVAALHPFRRGHRDPLAWNIACDAVVNHVVTEAGMQLPEGGVPGVPGKTAEELYEPPKKRSKRPQGKGPGQGEGDGEDAPELGMGGVLDPTGADGQPMSDAEREALIEETRIKVRQALDAQRRQGDVPAGLEQLVEEAEQPKVPWREVLARFVGGVTRNDYSWQRVNRRYASSGLLLPSLYTPGIADGVVGADLSGSMMGIVQEVVNEVRGVIEVYESRTEPPPITVLWFDADVYPQEVTDVADLKPQGGGGTSYVPVFKWVNEQAERTPAFVVMITDGVCDSFGDPPACPVLWILSAPNSHFHPPFGVVTCIMNE
jgi:predicted metal-dependent peptidase